MNADVDEREVVDCEFSFWKRYPSPKEYKKREGSTEVDVTIELSDSIIFVEAKYHSGFSTRTTYDEERDQIVRNLDVGLSFAQGKKKRFYLLIITNEPDPPELLTDYRKHPSKLGEKLPYRKSLNLISCLAWTNWNEIKNTLEEKLDEFSLVEKRFVNDVLRYLKMKS